MIFNESLNVPVYLEVIASENQTICFREYFLNFILSSMEDRPILNKQREPIMIKKTEWR